MLNRKMNELTRESVLNAIGEFDELTREGFLEKYNFGRALDWFILHGGRRYDAKAIAGVAHRYLGPGGETLQAHEFHTGRGSKALERLEELGFRLVSAKIAPESDSPDSYDPSNQEDVREIVEREVRERLGQQSFRNAILGAYGGRCAISGCAVPHVLEAAHICPYRGPDTNSAANGILLRADLHALFDRRLVTIDAETTRVRVSPSLEGSEYWRYQHRRLKLPRGSEAALRARQETVPLQ